MEEMEETILTFGTYQIYNMLLHNYWAGPTIKGLLQVRYIIKMVFRGLYKLGGVPLSIYLSFVTNIRT